MDTAARSSGGILAHCSIRMTRRVLRGVAQRRSGDRARLNDRAECQQFLRPLASVRGNQREQLRGRR